ncbi:MAG: cytochrome-c peroxidase, partial [Chitinophagaceae bacterium]|nr:cytochrome-c peroxidase [Chitinophagaceae bacterium]
HKVIEHYTSGIQKSATLDSALLKPIVLDPREKYDLERFLYTLTDSTFLINPAFGSPKAN